MSCYVIVKYGNARLLMYLHIRVLTCLLLFEVASSVHRIHSGKLRVTDA